MSQKSHRIIRLRTSFAGFLHAVWTLLRDNLINGLGIIQEECVSAQAAVVDARPNVTILLSAEKNQVDLIVLCSRGRSGLGRWLMGSVEDRVVHRATFPVLLVSTRKEEIQGASHATLPECSRSR